MRRRSTTTPPSARAHGISSAGRVPQKPGEILGAARRQNPGTGGPHFPWRELPPPLFSRLHGVPVFRPASITPRSPTRLTLGVPRGQVPNTQQCPARDLSGVGQRETFIEVRHRHRPMPDGRRDMRRRIGCTRHLMVIASAVTGLTECVNERPSPWRSASCGGLSGAPAGRGSQW